MQDRVARYKSKDLQPIGRKAAALLGGADRFGGRCEVEFTVGPGCERAQDSILLVLGLLLGRVADHARVLAMDSHVPSFVRDVRQALAQGRLTCITTRRYPQMARVRSTRDCKRVVKSPQY